MACYLCQACGFLGRPTKELRGSPCEGPVEMTLTGNGQRDRDHRAAGAFSRFGLPAARCLVSR